MFVIFLLQGRCNRDKPACKYFHPPQHLKDQLLINGRNHLVSMLSNFFPALLMTWPNKLYCLYLAITFRSSLTFAGNTQSLPKKEVSQRRSNRTANIRHQCRKTIVLSCHRCLINSGVEK
jgi:hypothetical protein